MDSLEREAELAGRLILAAENWAKIYDKDPENKARLIVFEGKLQRLMRKYFFNLAEKSVKMINWHEYYRRQSALQQAYDLNVDVLVTETIDEDDGLLMTTLYDPYATGIAIGAESGEVIYKKPLGLSPTSIEIQRAAKESVAILIGKRVTKNGEIIPNPNAKYHINNKTKKDIREAINTSISLGEDQEAATTRIRKTVRNMGGKRAELIAQTETVNAYNKGMYVFAGASGAVGKESQDSGAIDECRTYADMGIQPIDYEYKPGFKYPTYHGRCRCGIRLVYPEELE